MKIYHDADENEVWTRISAIKRFPIIQNRMDETSEISFIVADFEGALYATWEGYDFIPIKVTDEAGITLFRGFLTRKKYNANGLVCVARGLSAKLEWISFSRNYILQEGLIKAVPSGEGADCIDLKQDDEDNEYPDFSWAPDLWISGRNTGFLVVDNTSGVTPVYWDADSITDDGTGAVEENANVANVLAPYDFPQWAIYGNSVPHVQYQKVICKGDAVIDGAKYVKKIRVHYRYRMRLTNPLNPSETSRNIVRLQIKKTDDSWTDLTYSVSSNNKSNYTLEQYRGIGKDAEGIVVDDYVIEGTAEVMDGYIDLDVADDYEIITTRLHCNHFAGDVSSYTKIHLDYVAFTIEYESYDISPIMVPITDNGATWIESTGTTWAESGVAVGDSFKIGENTTQIIDDIAGMTGTVIFIQSTFSKYMAQYFRGTYCIEILKRICLLEGYHWWEDHVNNRIVVSLEADFVDSTEDLTQVDYLDNWEFEDDNNYYYKVEVFGAANYNIYAFAIDPDYPLINKSPMIKTIIEETIITIPEAQDVADAQLLELKTKRPSIKIPLKGIYTNLRVGTTVGLTMARPTVGVADYPIRMIQRKRLGHAEIETTIYCGLGHSTLEEKISNNITKAMYLAHKAHTDRLVSTPLREGAVITWSDIGGFSVGVKTTITAELVDGQSIDNAIDALVATENEISEMNDVDLTGIANNNILVYNAGTWFDLTPAEYADLIEAVIVHNNLAGLNAGDVYEHISQAQKDALHAAAHTLASHSTKAHAELSDAPADAHHVAFVQANADALYSVLAHLHDDRYYTEGEVDGLLHAEAHVLNSHSDVVIDAVGNNEVLAWDTTTTKWINQNATEVGLALAAHEHAHNNLTGKNDGDDWEHITQDQKNALHTIVTAGDLNHNDLANLNAGDVYEHISAAQLAALHTRLHTITDILDHSANNHKIFYSDGAGHVIELALGVDGQVLTSTGAATAPAFEAPAAGGSALQLPAWAAGGTAMTRDGAWHDVDISATYGAQKHLVFLFINTFDDAAAQNVYFRPKGSASTYISVQHQIANTWCKNFAQVHTDSDGVWQYKVFAAMSNADYVILAVLTP